MVLLMMVATLPSLLEQGLLVWLLTHLHIAHRVAVASVRVWTLVTIGSGVEHVGRFIAIGAAMFCLCRRSRRWDRTPGAFLPLADDDDGATSIQP